MKIAKVEYKCECGAEIIVGQEDLRKINEDKHVVIRCVWCGRTAENKKEIVDVLYKWSEG